MFSKLVKPVENLWKTPTSLAIQGFQHLTASVTNRGAEIKQFTLSVKIWHTT